jgi:hypothetical protein
MKPISRRDNNRLRGFSSANYGRIATMRFGNGRWRALGNPEPSLVGTWMNGRLLVEVILACNRPNESNA